MATQPSNAARQGDLKKLLGKLRRAGQNPDRALLDRVKARGQDAVAPLIEMAVDEKLHYAGKGSPEVWAPLHAIRILGELGAAEAVEPLLPLFGWDDDWLSMALPDAFGGIGEPALAPLRALLFDRTRDVWARIRAAEALSQIGRRHPETRAAVVRSLVARLDPAESQTPEDEILNAFVISGLGDLQAEEAASVVRRAFEEDRVDTSVVRLENVLADLGLPPERQVPRAEGRTGMRLRLRCTACHYEREHDVGTVYCDLGTQERKQRGETTPYSEYVLTRRITCPKCGAVDQYEFSSMAYIALLAEMLKQVTGGIPGKPEAALDEGESHLVPLHFTLFDGREMHPLEARDMYCTQVAMEPDRADLRVRYANVLRLLGYRDEAVDNYRAALATDPGNLEACLNLGLLTWQSGDRDEARQIFEHLLKLSASSPLPSETRDDYVLMAQDALSALRAGIPMEKSGISVDPASVVGREQPAPPVVERPAAIPRVDRQSMLPQHPVRVGPKTGRNDPCPCGSGKKYKKCHGR